MTTLPTWAVYVVSIGSPVLSFFAVLVAQWVVRRGARELEQRSQREEVMRTLRWAAELAVSPDEGKVELGVAELNALMESDLLDEKEKVFIEAALTTVIQDEVEEIEAIEAGGGSAEVIETDD